MKMFDMGRTVKNAIELIGTHPLVTGILAILGILGFVF